MSLLIALSLVLRAPHASFSPERGAAGLFDGQQEATNFSAHVAWSLALPLAGSAVADKRGAFIAGGAWLTYSLVNEFVFHGPEDARERRLNLVSRLVPCAIVMLVTALRNNK